MRPLMLALLWSACTGTEEPERPEPAPPAPAAEPAPAPQPPPAPAAPIRGAVTVEDYASQDDDVPKVVRRKAGQILYCYEKRLKENPDIAGRITVDVDISTGRVAETSVVENTTSSNELAECVAQKVQRWRFPETVNERARLPFVLKVN